MISSSDAILKKYEDVHIVTAKMEFITRAYNAAADIVYNVRGGITASDVALTARMLVLTRKISVAESVEISDKGFKVIINTAVVDDNASMTAFRMILKALKQLDGAQGSISFGDPIYLTLAECPELSANELQPFALV